MTKIKVRDDSKKKMISAEHERRFWVHDGQVLQNLKELCDAFENMSNETYQHHVTAEKNDFASWVEFILEDPMLAEKLRERDTREGSWGVTHTHLERYYHP